MQLLLIEDFEVRVGEAFALLPEDGGDDLTLVEVRPLTRPPGVPMMRDPFVLVLRSAVSYVLPQRIYRMTNAALGQQDIFIVPHAQDIGGVTYHAVFS